MKKLFFLFLCAGSACFADINFNPTPSFYELEGIKFPNVEFNFNGTKVSCIPIKGWHFSGDANRFRMFPDKEANAEITVSSFTVITPTPLDDKQIDKFGDELLHNLPSGCEKAVIVSKEKNPLIIGGNETAEIILSYSYYGQSILKSVVFVNLGKVYLRYELVASSNFKDVHELFRKNLYTWRGLSALKDSLDRASMASR